MNVSEVVVDKIRSFIIALYWNTDPITGLLRASLALLRNWELDHTARILTAEA